MTTLELVDAENDAHLAQLYALLAERTPQQAISHKKMPTFAEHVAFVRADPYYLWYRIMSGKQCVGAIYLTHNNEVGIGIFNIHKNKGHGANALDMLMRAVPDRRPIYANINPENTASQYFFKNAGFKLLQQTYILEG
ncbi:MAG: N-acetyltransferase [Chitinophagaceae bacterium]|nr:MAG: N-acetyltransferase [Chitinophagaceae bacterium]